MLTIFFYHYRCDFTHDTQTRIQGRMRAQGHTKENGKEEEDLMIIRSLARLKAR